MRHGMQDGCGVRDSKHVFYRTPPLRGGSLASIVAAIAVAVLLPACVSIGNPPAGQSVAVPSGKALVFGRIRMLDATKETIEYSPFAFDPWDQPFFGPGPQMTLELRQHYPPGGTFNYKTNPAPPIEANGSFYWILSTGDYELLGNPRLLGSRRFTTEETDTLAYFSVSTSGGTIYLGTLIISIVYDLQDVVRAWRSGESEYEIRGLRVVDERERDLAQLRERFPAFPEPVVTGYMRTE
jgi:hypothetical protein